MTKQERDKLNEHLIWAADDQNVRKVKKLLDAGADPNACECGGWTPLIVAVYNGDIKTVRLLIEHGADPDFADNNNWTALMSLAIWSGDTDLMETLVEAGADINAKNNDGQTALDILKNEHPEKYDKWIQGTLVKAKKKTLKREDSTRNHRSTPDFNI